MNQDQYTLIEFENVSKSYNRRLIFDSVSFKINNSNIFAIKGDNGKGKSTILKLILGIESYQKGNIKYFDIFTNKSIKSEEFNNRISFVSPYLQLYNDLTLLEIVNFYLKLRGSVFNKDNFEYYASMFEIYKFKNEYLKNYSSGMYQRVRILLSLLIDTNVYIYDEPTSNLDKKGIDCFYKIVDDFKKNNKTLIIASNEEREIELCDSYFSL